MSKLKSYQEQIQEAVAKGIKTVEEQHRALAAKPFDYAEKLEAEAKNLSVKFVRDLHDKTLDSVYGKLSSWNKKLNEYTSDLVAKFDSEKKEAPAKKKPATRKAPAKTAAKATEEAAA